MYIHNIHNLYLIYIYVYIIYCSCMHICIFLLQGTCLQDMILVVAKPPSPEEPTLNDASPRRCPSCCGLDRPGGCLKYTKRTGFKHDFVLCLDMFSLHT